MPTILTSGLMVNTVLVDMAKSAITPMTARTTMAICAFIYLFLGSYFLAPISWRLFLSAYFLTQESIQSMNVLYQSTLFCGFRTQWPSSGKSSSFDGTFCSCRAVNNSSAWLSGTRKSCSPWITRVGVWNSCTQLWGDHLA